MKRRTKIIIAILIFFGFLFSIPYIIERFASKHHGSYTKPISKETLELHKNLFVIDLHADSLMWNRNLLKRHSYGHVDIPRLIEGGIALQAFTIVSKVPPSININKTKDKYDVITGLAIAGLWPLKSWFNLSERVSYQIKKLNQFEKDSDDKFFIIRSKADLNKYIQLRKTTKNVTAGFLGLEGAMAIEANPNALNQFYKNGLRMIALTHFFDTTFAGSAHGEKKGGLTQKGVAFVKKLFAMKVVVDIAHLSEPAIFDLLKLATRPVLISHTGVDGTCNNARNISDEVLFAIKKNRGVVGLGYWPLATCGKKLASLIKAMKYIKDKIGIDYIALGSDWDGAVSSPINANEMPRITEALKADKSFSDLEIAKIMGTNALRVIKQNLPEI